VDRYAVPAKYVAEMDQAYAKTIEEVRVWVDEIRADLDAGAPIANVAMHWSIQLIEEIGERDLARAFGVLLTMLARGAS
jgi:hypothetical protein